MLVLSRKVGEKLVIGGNITVVVSRVAGNRVTLGIEAPSDVRVIRGELQFDVELPATADDDASASIHAEEPATISLDGSGVSGNSGFSGTVPFNPAAVRSAERSPARGSSPLAGRVARVKSDVTPRLAK